MAHTYAHDFDPSAHRTGYLPATDYALPHLSRFSVAHDAESHMLRHVNCSLLSTPGVPPTLLALKQHAQSLSYLIAMLEPHGCDDDAVEVLVGRKREQGVETRARKRQQRGAAAANARAASKASRDVDAFDYESVGLRRKVSFDDAEARAAKPEASVLQRVVTAARNTADHHATASPFDWLDFRRPYTNDTDPDHHRPLLDLVNEVREHHDVLGTTYHCPLSTYKPRNGGRFSAKEETTGGGDSDGSANRNPLQGDETDCTRPYATHHNLLMHANLCLERLDHEYAGTGGLLSILPTGITGTPAAEAVNADAAASESPLVAAARNTLVGQWLVFTQQLVGRMHELEIAYANAVHALAGETVLAPLVSTGRVSIVGGKPVLVDVAPEAGTDKTAASSGGRWILANAGADVWSSVHDMLDKAAAADAASVAQRRSEGVVGERGVTPGTQASAAALGGTNAYLPDNHLVYVDVATRFYRTGVIGPVATATAKAAPLGLTANVPLLSASALERRYDGQLREAARIARDNTDLTERLIKRTNVLLTLRRDHGRIQMLNKALQTAVDLAEARLRKMEAELAAVKAGGSIAT